MTLQEILKSQGLSEEQVEKIVGETWRIYCFDRADEEGQRWQ